MLTMRIDFVEMLSKDYKLANNSGRVVIIMK
jgi:hypothetical protein